MSKSSIPHLNKYKIGKKAKFLKKCSCKMLKIILRFTDHFSQIFKCSCTYASVEATPNGRPWTMETI